MKGLDYMLYLPFQMAFNKNPSSEACELPRGMKEGPHMNK